MLCRSISWFFYSFVAVATATRYSGEDYISVPDPELGVHHLRTDNPESATAERVPKVEPSRAVDLGALLDAGGDAVVTLVAGETRLAAHRAVLAARSPAFQRILRDAGPGEVAIPDVQGAVLRELVAYLYSLPAPQLPGMAPPLLDAADRYGLSALKVDCEQHEVTQPSLDTEAAAAAMAARMSCYSLRDAAVAYIRAHILHVMATMGWADATERQQEAMTNVTQLVSHSLAETSSLAPAAHGTTIPYHATESDTVHSSYGGQQTPTTATPNMAAHTITREYITYLRSLPPKEKGRRLREAADLGEVGELQALLAVGATVGAAEEGISWRVLHKPAAEGHTAVVRLLLAAGADPNARDFRGWTPLHYAAHNGQREAAAALLEGGADTVIWDQFGLTALDRARLRNEQQVAALLQGW